MVVDHGTCDHDLKEEIEMLVKLLLSISVMVFIMMNVLTILQVQAGKTSQNVRSQSIENSVTYKTYKYRINKASVKSKDAII